MSASRAIFSTGKSFYSSLAEEHHHNGVAPDRIDFESESMERLCDWLKTKRRVVILSGAGCSTESGLPDYRSPRFALFLVAN